jgi:hypothetical protein
MANREEARRAHEHGNLRARDEFNVGSYRAFVQAGATPGSLVFLDQRTQSFRSTMNT